METHKLSLGSEVVTVNVHEAKDLLRSGHRFLDVRTREEFRQGHVENSLNIPYMFDTPEGRVKNPKFMNQVLAAFNKEDHIVLVYGAKPEGIGKGCRSGVRSLYAAVDLMKEDFKDVRNMGGGFIAWVDNGFAVKKPVEPEL